MVEIAPFRGIFYNPEKVRLEDVVSLPYDKVGEDLRLEYLRRSPYNVVSLIRPTAPSEGGERDPYTWAGNLWRRWLEEGVLVQDEREAFYVYHQRYRLGGEYRTRRGFIGLLRLREFFDGVYPHETTFAGPKEDRFRLLEATEANFGQIFALYSDPGGGIARLFSSCTEREADVVVRLEDLDEVHSLWKVEDAEILRAVQAGFSSLRVYIADGHHRYETALSFYRHKRKQLGEGAALEPYGYRMMTFVDMEDEGLTIFPTHRVVLRGGFSVEEFRASLERRFRLVVLSPPEGERERAEWLTSWLAQREGGRMRMVVVLREEFWGLELGREEVEARYLLAGELVDVVILHDLILKELLQLPLEQRDEGEVIRYMRHTTEVLEGVSGGKYPLAFLLHPISVEQLRRITEKGERLPQKSTDFYPKMLSGLVMYSMREV